MNQEQKWFYGQRIKVTVKNFLKKNISAQYAASRQEALDIVLGMITAGAVVSRGDSITVDQVGIIPELFKRGQNKIIDPLARDAQGQYLLPELEQRKNKAREVFSSDIFLVGTNAVTMDGKLVNIDAWGNRVAPMIFGPDKVIVIAGVNKIVKDVDAALDRIHNYAAPMNAKRHAIKHQRKDFGDLPCAKGGICVDCNHDWRICRYTTIIEGATIREKERISVVLVGEDLGI